MNISYLERVCATLRCGPTSEHSPDTSIASNVWVACSGHSDQKMSDMQLSGHAARMRGPAELDSGTGATSAPEPQAKAGICLCPSWAHGPDCRVLPSPIPSKMPVQDAGRGERAPKISLPSWSKSSRTARGYWPKPMKKVQLSPRPRQQDCEILQTIVDPLESTVRRGEEGGARRYGGVGMVGGGFGGGGDSKDTGGALAIGIRMQSKFPRLTGADAQVVLWELHEAQRQVTELSERLFESEAARSKQQQLISHREQLRMSVGYKQIQMRISLGRRANMLRLWSMHTKREEMDRQLTQIESEFAQRERSLMLQLAEKDKQISGLTQQIRADANTKALMEQENKELKKENQELRRAGMQTEERCNLKMSEMRNALEMQVEEGRKLGEQLGECKLELNALKASTRQLRRTHAEQKQQIGSLLGESRNCNALEKRLLTLMEAMGEREQASLQGHIMQHQEGFAEVRQANAFYLQSGQSQKLAIFGMPVSKLKKTHAKALLIGGGGDWGSQRGWSEMGNGSGVMMEDGREDMVLYQMQREFLECSDPRVFRLSTWNYTCGPLETDLETEWEFARCPIPGKAYPGQYGYAASGKMRRFGRPQTHANAHAIVSRTSIPLEQMLLREEARKAGLKPSEVLAIRLFTGPCHKVINDVLRHQLKIRGKCECPKYTYFDMPLLMESLVETAGPNDWHAAWGPDWAHVWKTITAEMKLSDMFALKMFEIMAEVHPGPTTGVLISGTQKRVVVFEFIVEGDWWRPWNEVGEGFFVHRFTEEDMQKEAKKKREQKRKDEMKRKRGEAARKKKLEEEEMRLYEEQMAQKRRDHEAQRANTSSAGSSRPTTREGGESQPMGLSGGEPQPKGLSGVTEDQGDERDDERYKVMKKYLEMLDKMSALLGEEWHVQLCPIDAPDLGISFESHRSGRAGVSKDSGSHPERLIPHEWCCHETFATRSEGRPCENSGCIHKLAEALQIPSAGILSFANTVLQASVHGGCGKHAYGACLDPSRCPACVKGELWNCSFPRQSPCERCAPGVDTFPYTIAALTSSLVKLFRCLPTTAMQGSLVYRGLTGLALPLPHDDAVMKVPYLGPTDMCEDFVERAFSSTTTLKEVARQYAGVNMCKSITGQGVCQGWDTEKGICTEHQAIVLEIETGRIHGLAHVAWVSQWPHEDEYILPPDSTFQVTGMRREGHVNYLRLRVHNDTDVPAPTRNDACVILRDSLMKVAQELQQETCTLLQGSPLFGARTVQSACQNIKSQVLESVMGREAGVTLSSLMGSGECGRHEERAFQHFNEAMRALLSTFSDLHHDIASKHIDFADALVCQLRNLRRRSQLRDGAEWTHEQEATSDGSQQSVAQHRTMERAKVLRHRIDAILEQALRIVHHLGSGYVRGGTKTPDGLKKSLEEKRDETKSAEERRGGAESVEEKRGGDEPAVSKDDATDDNKAVAESGSVTSFETSCEARIYNLQVEIGSLCADSADRLAYLHEKRADMLCAGEANDLMLAREGYAQAFSLLSTPSPQIIFKRAVAGIRMREHGDAAASEIAHRLMDYEDLLKEFTQCLGLISKEISTHGVDGDTQVFCQPDKQGSQAREISSLSINDEACHLLKLMADVHLHIGIIQSRQDEVSASLISLLEALRLKVRQYSDVETILRYLRALMLKFDDNLQEEHRLLPCSICQILCASADSSTLQLGAFIDQVLREADSTYASTILEWGFHGIRCVLQTPGMDFVQEDYLLVVETVMKGLGLRPADRGTIEQGCLTLIHCFKTTQVLMTLRSSTARRAVHVQQYLIRLCIDAMFIHKDDRHVRAAALHVVYCLLKDEDESSLTKQAKIDRLTEKLAICGTQTLFDISYCMLESLAVMHGDEDAVDHALQVLQVAIESDAVRSMLGFSSCEAALVQVINSHAQDTSHDFHIRALGKACLDRCRVSIDEAKLQHSEMRALWDRSMPIGGIERSKKSDGEDLDDDFTADVDKELLERDVMDRIASAKMVLHESEGENTKATIEQARSDVTQAATLLQRATGASNPSLDKTQELWQLDHCIVTLTAICTLDQALQSRDLQGAQEASQNARRAISKCSEEFSRVQQPHLDALDLRLATALQEKAKEDMLKNHRAAGNAAKESACGALASIELPDFLHVFHRTVLVNEEGGQGSVDVNTVENVVNEDVQTADLDNIEQSVGQWRRQGLQTDELHTPTGIPAVPHGKEHDTGGVPLLLAKDDAEQGNVSQTSRTPVTTEPADAINQGVESATDASNCAEGQTQNKETPDKINLLEEHLGMQSDNKRTEEHPSVMSRLCEIQRMIAEARKHFSECGEDRMGELETVESGMTTLLLSARTALVTHVNQLLQTGDIGSAMRCISRGIATFEDSGFGSVLDDVDLESRAQDVAKVMDLINDARLAIAEEENVNPPRHLELKRTHFMLVSAARLLTKGLDDCGSSERVEGDGAHVADRHGVAKEITTPRETVAVLLQRLHFRCADLLLLCPRPFSLETREIYHMAKMQADLGGKDACEKRTEKLDRFAQELSSWEGEPLVLDE